jgi:phosphoribosylanthranilate isomerase
MLELPRIKVCGLTRVADVRVALEAGADALGFVRHGPSPRDLSAAEARALVALVPAGFKTVAVMVNPDPDQAAEFLAATGLGWLQLCGSESPEPWRGFGAPLLRRVAVDDGARAELESWAGIATGFVLDHPSAPGGTGRACDQAQAQALAQLAPCLLAGGLGPANVSQAIDAVQPRGVDASSQLEAAPGHKDPAAVLDFVRAARAAFEERAR